MKKFNICLFLLIIFSGIVFYLGWTQYKVDADKCGILISKTSGVCDEPVENGKFSWHWELLLPTNTVLKKFSITPVNMSKTISGELPSGSIYSAIYNSNDNFTYSFEYSISVTVSPKAIVKLYKENKITNDEDLTQYLSGAVNTIAQLSTDFYLSKCKENPLYNIESIRRDDIVRGIQIYKEYPEVEIITLSLTSSKTPDFELYKKLKTEVIQSE